MSRSRKKHPCWAICGYSAHNDKRLANKGVRRKTKQAISKYNNDNFLLPHKYECSHNEVWTWTRDGKQRWQFIKDYYTEPTDVIEVDEVTQVCRVLDGEPAIRINNLDRRDVFWKMIRK